MTNVSLTENQMREKTQQGLASLALERMYPSKEMLADMELMITGKISKNEFVSRGIKIKKSKKHTKAGVIRNNLRLVTHKPTKY